MNAAMLPRMKPFSVKQFDTAEGSGYWCVMAEGCSPLKVTAPVLNLIRELEKEQTLPDLLAALGRQSVVVSEEEVVQTIQKLEKLGLFVDSQPPETNTVLWVKVRLLSGAPLQRFVRPMTWLFHPAVMGSVSVSAIAGSVLFLLYLYTPSPLQWNNGSIFGIGLYFATLLFHELGHVTAATFFGINVPDLGFGLYVLRPVLYSDLTEAWGLNRWQRVVVNLGGIYFQLLASLVMLVIYLVAPSQVLGIAIQLTLFAVLYNLNPSLRYDGFWILSDIIGLSNIHDRTRKTIKALFQRLIGRPSEIGYEWRSLKPWVRNVYLTYMTVYAAAFTVAIGAMLWLVVAWLTGLRQVGWGDRSLFVTVFAALGVQTLGGFLRQLKRKSPRST